MKHYLLSILILPILIGCGSNNSTQSNEYSETIKFSESDPFKNTITESQFFEIDANKDNTVVGNQGTLIAAPKGCFLDKNGNPVTGNIKIELTECLSAEEMILSNLTTTSNGNPLETDGMVYINATSNGEQLRIDKSNPIYVEIPTEKVKAGMQVYKGSRDENGNMEWSEPKDLENYLVSIDLTHLDFLPKGFAAAVESGMPFRSYETATVELIDSLYYSLSESNGSFLTEGFENTDYNEAYNLGNNVIDGKYTDESFETNSNYYTVDTVAFDIPQEVSSDFECGVDPAKIKLLKTETFQNTLISTREFEERLQVIYKICRTDLVDMYVNNIEKDMYVIDRMVASKLKGNKIYQDQFIEFSEQKKTNVPGDKKYAAQLKEYYETELIKIKEELESAKNKAMQELQAKNEVADSVANEYKDLLFKRETFRMEKYGFEWSETGWLNIDNGTIPKTWGPQRLEIFIKDGKMFERVYTYVIYISLKSLYRLNTNDGELFFVGNENERQMLMPKKEMAVVISIGYKGDQSFLGITEFTTGDQKVEISLTESSIEKIKAAILPYDNYTSENKIDRDLEYMEFFAKERERQKALISERKFIQSLWWIAFPCCEAAPSVIQEIRPH